MENSRVLSRAQSVDFLVSIIGSPYALVSGLKKEDETFVFPKAKVFLDNFIQFLNVGWLINQPLGVKEEGELINISNSVIALDMFLMRIIGNGYDVETAEDYMGMTAESLCARGGEYCPILMLLGGDFYNLDTAKDCWELFSKEPVVFTEEVVHEFSIKVEGFISERMQG